jgi:hypothetical protein
MLQDLGGTFGPTKLDLQNWKSTLVWADARTCLVSMERLPFGGGTFEERTVSEEGRLLLLRLLEQFSREQIEGLFDSAGADDYDAVRGENRSPAAWATAFEHKVQQIRDAGPCSSD